jgi:hypothetical protein
MDISKLLLLRQVHALGLSAFTNKGEARVDSDLKATDLSLKSEFSTRKKKRQLELAQGLYLKVMGGKVDRAKMEEAEKVWGLVFQNINDSADDSEHDDYEDEYVDKPASPRTPRIEVDSSLFQGLHELLGWDEKVFLTALFTNGEVAKLLQAAMILNGVLKLSMQPPASRPKVQGQNRTWNQQKKVADILERMKKSFPLPNHMPGYFIVPSFSSRSNYISFKDETWDGTILPPLQSNTIFKHVYGGHYNPPNKENPRPIVTISGVRGPAGRVGMRKGDIVTHVNESEWAGTAKELLEHIHLLHEHHNEETISITVNATPEAGKFLQVRKDLMAKARIELA